MAQTAELLQLCTIRLIDLLLFEFGRLDRILRVHRRLTLVYQPTVLAWQPWY